MANSNRNLLVLALACAIQHVGASAKRRFLFLLKALVLLVPSTKSLLDQKLKGARPVIDEMKDRTLRVGWGLGELPAEGRTPSQILDALWSQLTELMIDVLLWLLTACASVFSLIGVMIEFATDVVADLLRDGSDFDFRKRLQELSERIKTTTDAIKEAFNANDGWRIVPVSNTRDCAAEITTSARAFSFCAQASGYTDSGVRYDFRLRNGRVEFARHVAGVNGFARPTNQTFTMLPDRGWSFHEKRAGIEVRDLRFDMIVASNDRVFAKCEGRADFYFAVMDDLFANTAGPCGENVPPLYFKLDPEFGLNTDPRSLVNQISQPSTSNDADPVLKKYARHPQADRLPMLHAAVAQGALDAMIVVVKPRTWYRLDTRPPCRGVALPALPELPTREASLYSRTGADTVTQSRPQMEYDFESVLGLGVGNFHFYESWNEDFGGEIQPLHQRDPFGLPLNMSFYGLFNGPIWDGDGACDGTCNFYILVRFKGGDRYGILWCDEQTYFTKRWRLLDPRDCEPSKIELPFDVNLSLVAALKRDADEGGLLDGQYRFDPDVFIRSDPFERGWINDESRMSVARQVVLVTGVGSDGAPRIFSVNFSYGSIDRRWRSRQLPSDRRPPPAPHTAQGPTHPATGENGAAHGRPEPPVASPPRPQVDAPNRAPVEFEAIARTIHLREDMTMSLEGTGRARPGDPFVRGRWFQRYLPCHRRHPGAAEGYAYSHPWRFLPQAAFERADCFSHFGVYDRVDSRNQYYLVEVLSEPLIGQQLGSGVTALEDHGSALSIRAIKFNWGWFNDVDRVATFLADSDPPGSPPKSLPAHIRQGTEAKALADQLLFRWDRWNDAARADQYRASCTSAHNPHARFRLLERGALGTILVWDDKRDDDLIELSDLPVEATLSIARTSAQPDGPAPLDGFHLTPVAMMTLRITKNVRVSSLPNVARVRLSKVRGNKLRITIDTEQTRLSAMTNLWRIRIYALPESGPTPLKIYDKEDLMSAFSVVGSERASWLRLQQTIDLEPSLAQYLDAAGAQRHATSVWFEDVVGHVSTPDEIDFGA